MYWNSLDVDNKTAQARLTLTWDVLKLNSSYMILSTSKRLTLTWDVLKLMYGFL